MNHYRSIKLMKNNIYYWSKYDFQCIFEYSIKSNLHHVFKFKFMFKFMLRDNGRYGGIVSINDDIHNDIIKVNNNYTISKSFIKGRIININDYFGIKCEKGRIDIVKYLLSDEVTSKYDIDPTSRGNLAIGYACEEGRIDIVKYLLSDEVTSKYDIDPTDDDNYAIGYACGKGQMEIVKYLLSDEVTSKYDIDPTDDDNYVIRFACRKDRIDIVKYLLSDEVTNKYDKLKFENLSKYEQNKIEILIH